MLKRVINFFLKPILALSKAGYQRSLQRAFNHILSDHAIHLVDIGAAGDIEPRWKQIQTHLSYVGFEPDDRSRELLQHVPNRLRSYAIRPEALGETTGNEISFYLCRKPQVSSSYIPNKEFITLFPDSKRFDVLSTVRMQHWQLDDIVLPDADFIKIDTQGSELSILKGAPDTLQSVLGLEIEVEFLPLYKDQPLFGEICTFLRDHGFEFIDFINLCRWQRTIHNGVGQCIFGDALFFKTPETLLTHDLSNHKIASYLGCLLLYHRFDLIRRTLTLLPHHHREFFKEFQNSFSCIERRFNSCLRVNQLSSSLIQSLIGVGRNHLIY